MGNKKPGGGAAGGTGTSSVPVSINQAEDSFSLPKALHAEADVEYITVNNDILLALHIHFAGLF